MSQISTMMIDPSVNTAISGRPTMGKTGSFAPPPKPKKPKRRKGEDKRFYQQRVANYKQELEGWKQQYSTANKYIIGRMDQAQKEAETANKQRYEDILAEINKAEQGQLGQVGAMETAGMRRIDEAALRNTGTAEQDLIDRGLGNTTIRSSVRRGIAADKEKSIQDLQAQLAGMRMGVIGGESQRRTGVMERRTDLPGGSFSDTYRLQKRAQEAIAKAGQGGGGFDWGGLAGQAVGGIVGSAAGPIGSSIGKKIGGLFG